jgi:SAM-dependent methyltransferase
MMAWKGVDVRGVSVEGLGLDQARSSWYSDSGGPDLDAVFGTFSILPTDAVLDIGCGKGGALITLARYAFARVDGLEISPELVRVARKNLLAARIFRANVFCSDAAEFSELDEYTYLYMYNPFPAVVVRKVLENVFASVARRPRRLTLVYKNPVCDDLVRSCGFRAIRDFADSSLLFRAYVTGT